MFPIGPLNTTTARGLLLCAAMAAAACGDAGSLVEVNDPEEYLDALPDYPEPPEAFDRATAGAKFEHTGDAVCSTTTYEIGEAPADVVMFNTDPQVFWPGALIQGESYESGSPLLIPMPNRAPLNISVQGLYAENASAFDVVPTQSEVNQAVSGLPAGAVRNDTPATQSVFFNQKEAYSFGQSALKLGFSARYLGARVKGSRISTSRARSTVGETSPGTTRTVARPSPQAVSRVSRSRRGSPTIRVSTGSTSATACSTSCVSSTQRATPSSLRIPSRACQSLVDFLSTRPTTDSTSSTRGAA